MKKFLAFVLSCVMIFSLAVPAFAVDLTDRSKIPVVAISGDGEQLYKADGTKIKIWKDLLGSEKVGDETDITVENIAKSIAKVIYSYAAEGLLTGNWEPYYETIYNEVSKYFSGLLLDKNGEASDGSGISQDRKNQMKYESNIDRKWNGTYGSNDYHFYYDWRLDPYAVADDFNEYIKNVKAATGVQKVALTAKCLGTSVAISYIAKYGTDDICALAIDGSVVGGVEILGETISGRFNLDTAAISRVLTDCDSLGIFSVEPILTETLDLLDKSGMVDVTKAAVKTKLYYQLEKGVTSSLALASMFSHPSYWAIVCSEDLELAKEYVFGEEGSAKRAEYAGLIEKIDSYDKNVRQKLPEIFKEIDDNANLCIISKYGFQMIPTGISRNKLGDQFSSVEKSSFGATTSDIYGTLDEDYIAKRVAEGKGRYISPDKQIDASTCMFPDYTWFVKNVKHSNWSWYEDAIMMTVINADRQLTIDDLDLTQFMVYNYSDNKMYAMNTENCDTYNWKADKEADNPSNIFERLKAFINSFIKWFKTFVDFASKKLQSSPAA